VRYDTAPACWAFTLKDKAPDKVCDVLLDMIGNTTLKVFDGTDATIEGRPGRVQGRRLGDRATYGRAMLGTWAAEAMGFIGREVQEKLPGSSPLCARRLWIGSRSSRRKAEAALKELGLPIKE